MTNETRALILRALGNYRGDNHIRAARAFAGLSKEVMDSLYGESGQTRRQILDDYNKHAAEVDAAILAIKQLP